MNQPNAHPRQTEREPVDQNSPVRGTFSNRRGDIAVTGRVMDVSSKGLCILFNPEKGYLSPVFVGMKGEVALGRGSVPAIRARAELRWMKGSMAGFRILDEGGPNRDWRGSMFASKQRHTRAGDIP